MKKIISLALSAIMLIALFLPVSAVEIGTKDSGNTPVYSNNINDHNYINVLRWSTVENSYLYKNGNGGYTRVEYVSSSVVVEEYDADFRYLSGSTVEMELPLFGGFFSGENYNYIVFGQNNPDESDAVEVIRIVKYSKSWEKLGADSLFGANTLYPFSSGALRMTESGNRVFVRTCHKMYISPRDGLNHQANLTFVFDSSSNEIIDSYYIVMNSSMGYISHSFNQFIRVDGDNLICADHGDAHPRASVICRYNRSITANNILQGGTTNANAMEYPAVPEDSNFSKNDTGASMGGFETTSVGYMIAGNANPDTIDYNAQRNIYLTVTPRDGYPSAETKLVWLTDHASGVTVSNPHLVKVNDDKLLVMWTENGVVKYVFVDGNGDRIGDIVTDNNMKVSDCQPILDGDRIIWYVTKNSAPMFYYIYAGEGEAPEATPVPTEAPTPTAVPTPTPVPTPVPTEAPTDGELVVDRYLKAEADGTLTLVISAYSTGTLHDASSVLYTTFGGIGSYLNCQYRAYTNRCIGFENGKPVFSTSKDYSVNNQIAGKIQYYSGGWYVSGFDYRANTCYEGGGKRFVIQYYNVLKPNENTSVTISPAGKSGMYSSVEALRQGSAADVAAPDAIAVHEKNIVYDFVTPLSSFSVDGLICNEEITSVVSIGTAMKTFVRDSSTNAYDYSTSVSGEGYAASISDGRLSLEVLSSNAESASIKALVLNKSNDYEWININFLPATTVHYEDDFASYDSGDYGNGSYAEWSACGTPVDAYQSGENTLYGYDASYASQQGDGNGSAMKVTVDKALFEQVKKPNSGAAWPKAEFTFTGTGVDIIGRVGADTGAVLAKIVPNGIDGQSAVSRIIDTYYPGVYGDVLYQCPIVHVTGLKYGEYTVTLTPIYMPGYDHQSVATSAPDAETNGGEYVRNIPGLPEGEYELVRLFDGAAETTRGYGEFNFYFDGFRVYDPLGNDSAQSAYLEAGEYKPIYKSVKKLVQNQADSDEGALFFMLDDENNRVSSTDYVDVNFNTELYALAQGGAAFKIEGSYERVLISLRAPAGKTVVYSINGHEFTISHTAELYYDITDLIGSDKRVAVTCLESGSDQGAVLSIVNIKLTSENPTKNGSGAEPRIVWDEELIEFVEAMYFGVMGDADHDGSVTVMDALTVMRSVLGSVQLGTYGSICADVDNDGIISVLDALAIIRIALAIE